MQSVSYLASLRRRWPLILVLAVAGLALGFLAAPSTSVPAGASPLDISHGGWAARTIVGIPPQASASASTPSSSRAVSFYAGDQAVAQAVTDDLKLGVSPSSVRGALSFAPTTNQDGVQIIAKARTQKVAIDLANGFVSEESHYLEHIAKAKRDQAVARDKTQVGDLRAQAKALAKQVRKLQGKTSSKAMLRTSVLESQRTSIFAAYQTAYQTYVTAKSSSAPTGFFVVLQRASTSTSAPLKTSPLKKRPVRAIVGLIAGLAVGIIIALMLAQLDRRLRSTKQMEQAFGLPVLVEVPRQRLRGNSRDVVVATEPTSATAEAYRQLRTMLVNAPLVTKLKQVATSGAPSADGLADGVSVGGVTVGGGLSFGSVLTDEVHPPEPAVPSAVAALRSGSVTRPISRHATYRSPSSGHVIVISSASDERIRPTVAANIAVAFSEIDASVLLIRTGASTDHSIPDGVEIPAPVDLSKVIRPSGLPHVQTLDLTKLSNSLPAGRSMADLIADASELADVIVIEAAPVLAAHDVGVLSALADDVLVVAEYGYTDSEAASQAAELLARMGVRPRGVVVTQVPARQGPSRQLKKAPEPQLELSGGKA